MSQNHEGRPMRPIHKNPSPLGSRFDASGPNGSDPDRLSGFEQLRGHAVRALELARRQSRVFLVFAGVTALVLVTAVVAQTPLYESTSLLLVKFGRELVYQPEVGSEQAFATRDKASVINSELAILRSEPVLKAVVQDIGVGRLYPDLGDDAPAEPSEEEQREEVLRLAEASERLRLGLSAQALPEAEVLQISFRHADPIVGADTVNAVVSHFLEAHLSAFSEPEVVDFLEERVNDYDERLIDSERKLRDFESQHYAFALESPQQMLLQRREEQRAELNEIDSQMAAIRLRHLQADDSVNQARSNLLELQVEASRLRGDGRREIEGRIDVVNRFIETRRSEMSTELERLEAKLMPLREALAGTEQELANLPRLSAEYRRLRRDRDGDEEQYATYKRRLRDARLSGEMDRQKIASINVIQPGAPSARPVWPPSKPASVCLALVLAAIAGGLAVVAADRFGPTGIAWLDGDGEPGEREAA